MCNSCSKPLTGSKYYEVICRDARDHSREEKIDEMQNKSRRSEEHDKEKEERISNYKKALMALDDEELDLIVENMKSKLAKLRAELENPDKEEKDKETKQASVEFIGAETYHSVGRDVDTAAESLVTLQRHRKKKLKHSQSYNVLTLEPYESVTHAGDRLLMKMGSTDSDSVSDTSGDELLKKLGSVD